MTERLNSCLTVILLLLLLYGQRAFHVGEAFVSEVGKRVASAKRKVHSLRRTGKVGASPTCPNLSRSGGSLIPRSVPPTPQRGEMSFADMSIRTEGSLDGESERIEVTDAAAAFAKVQRTTAAGSTPAIRTRLTSGADILESNGLEHVVTPHASGAAREHSVLRSCLPTDLLLQFEEASKTRSGRAYSPIASPASDNHRCFASPSVVAAAIVRGQAPPPPYPGSASRMSYRRAMVNSGNMAVQKRAAPRRRVPYPNALGEQAEPVRLRHGPGSSASAAGSASPAQEAAQRAPPPGALPRYRVQEPRRLEIRTAPRGSLGAAKDTQPATVDGSSSAPRPSSRSKVLRPANGARGALTSTSKTHKSVDVSDEALDFLGLNRSLFARLQLASPRAGVAYLNGHDNIMGSDV